MGFGAIGWVDDWRKVVQQGPRGHALAREVFLAVGDRPDCRRWPWCSAFPKTRNSRAFELFVDLGAVGLLHGPAAAGRAAWCRSSRKSATRWACWASCILTYLVIVGASNAVNLTDGLDGLAIMPVIMVGTALGIFAYVTGNGSYAKYLHLPSIPGTGELMIFCGAMAGAGLAFLWFNAHPAQIFMGDVGALALGGALGTIAVIVRQEIVLAIMGGIFVAEALSVMLQVVWFKYTKKRYGEGRRSAEDGAAAPPL